MRRTFLQGSAWRRWDPHIHTPETVLNDQYRDWEEFLSAIESRPDVSVLGVTDYMSITNYLKLRDYRRQGRIQQVELLIPNLEFRVAPPTERATAVNLHLLVSPEDPGHEDQIRNALARLFWEYRGRRYSCLPDQLEALGRAHKPGINDNRAALAEGITQFKVDFSTLREWHRGEPWLRHNSLVAIDAGKDGLSGFRKDGAWEALRDEMTRFADFLFSGRPGEREFWLGEGDEEQQATVIRLGGPRACLHGSDAHGIDRLFRPDGDRFCWVKADPTFEGLRQVLYEPGDRAHIGPSAPAYHDEARVIESIRLQRTNGWFDETKIPLNSGLVSIIGQKGSGKSALAEMMAFAAGSWKTDESGSFLRRAGAHVEGVEVELKWADGATTTARLGDTQSDEGRVRYLSQKFVDRLCSDDHLGSELVREIEAVIFAYLDPTDTLNASNFEELRAIRTEGIRAEGDRLRQEVIRLIHEECELRDNEAKVPTKRTRIKKLEEERASLLKQMPAPATAEEAKVREQLQVKRDALTAMQQGVATEKQKLQKIRDIRGHIVRFRGQIERFADEIEVLLDQVGIPELERDVFRPAFPSDPEPVLVRREGDIQAVIQEREGKAEDAAEGTIRRLQTEIRRLQETESADKARQEKVKTIQTRVAEINAEIEKLNAEIAQIEGPGKVRKDEARNERSEAYVQYFQNLKLEHETLADLYEPVRERLTSGDGERQEQELEFSIRWEADLRTWVERGAALFDQRKRIPYETIDGLEEAARRILVPAWTSGNPSRVGEAMHEFLEAFRKPDLLWNQYAKSGVTVKDIFEWLYEVAHVRLSYGLKYNGVELEKLSPGTKGIVLLILYLGMDTADTRPLIVDQPDENLDNESIYTLLAAYFRKAKKRRQVILITHNPNLVVNGDSEQVIVATCARQEDGLPYITYESGSLENREIRGQVCRILEGGADAFLKRERRYALAEA